MATIENDPRRLLNTPDKIVEAGEQFYAQRHKERLEREHPGHFVAIDVTTGEAFVGEFAEVALQTARAKAPHGIFHLIRIGAPGAFKVSYVSGRPRDGWDRFLRP